VRPLILLVCLAGCAGTQVPPVREASVGTSLDFEAPRLAEDGMLRLSSLRGKVVVVDVWASWCVPCRASFPFYDALRRELGEGSFEVVAVSVDVERDLAVAFLHEVSAVFPVVWDEGQRLVSRWQPSSMPTAFLVDRDGVVRHVHQGFDDDSPAQLGALIRALVAAPSR
jgi:cytochrome c biogenesis protein CcmG, thiol:disulfide interchange protein DsbE